MVELINFSLYFYCSKRAESSRAQETRSATKTTHTHKPKQCDQTMLAVRWFCTRQCRVFKT